MKKLLVGFLAGAATAAAGSALAFSSGHSYALKLGDSAYFNDPATIGQPTCQVVPAAGVRTFSCFVSDGAQNRKKFSVTISASEVTVSQYFGPSAPKPYKVLFRRIQTPIFIAH